MQIFTYELTESELMNWQDNVIVQFRKKMGEGIDCVHRASSQLGLLKNPCDRLHLLNMFCIIIFSFTH